METERLSFRGSWTDTVRIFVDGDQMVGCRGRDVLLVALSRCADTHMWQATLVLERGGTQYTTDLPCETKGEAARVVDYVTDQMKKGAG